MKKAEAFFTILRISHQDLVGSDTHDLRDMLNSLRRVSRLIEREINRRDIEQELCSIMSN